jgi:hypothetical protein
MSQHSMLPDSALVESCTVRFAGTSVNALFEIDVQEHERRVAAGAGPVVERDLLETFAELPLLEHIEWTSIDPMKQALLDTAPPGALATAANTVARLWRPALRLHAVTRTARHWRQDLEAVSLFAPDAPRYLIVGRRPAADHPMVAEANWLGVGIVLHDGDLVLPAERLPASRTPRHWRLLESVYEAWLGSAEIRSATSN